MGLCEDRVPHDPMVNLVVIFSLRLAILGEKTPLTPFWCQPSTLSWGEFVGAMLKKEGFQDVWKLRGGVQHYGNSLGARHWDGRLFVFDRRDSIAVGKYDEASVVGRCHVCGKPCEDVWNCHNYECNRTMVACEQCMQSMKGCCCTLVLRMRWASWASQSLGMQGSR